MRIESHETGKAEMSATGRTISSVGRQLSAEVVSEIRALVAKEAALNEQYQQLDRATPELPADVGDGDLTSILTLLEIRALNPDQATANTARAGIEIVYAVVAAKKRIAAAETALAIECSEIRARRRRLQYGVG